MLHNTTTLTDRTTKIMRGSSSLTPHLRRYMKSSSQQPRTRSIFASSFFFLQRQNQCQQRPLPPLPLLVQHVAHLSSSSSDSSSSHVWGDIKPKASSTAASTTISSNTSSRRVVRRQPGTAPQPKAEEVDFLKASSLFFDRVEQGVASMRALNDPFTLQREETELVLDLGPTKGAFTLQRDWVNNQLVYLSPVSGLNKYEYEVAEQGVAGGGRWLSIAEDKHDLVGILTRDLIRVAVGCPQI